MLSKCITNFSINNDGCIDLNNNNLETQIAVEEEAICIAKEMCHDNDFDYHTAVLQSLKKLKGIMNYLEPLRNTNTHNEHLDRLKEMTR